MPGFVTLKGGAQVYVSGFTSLCRGCKAKIAWADTREGRKMPVTIQADGTWVSHFSICPNANNFRRNETSVYKSNLPGERE